MSMEGDKGAEGLRFIMYCHAIAHTGIKNALALSFTPERGYLKRTWVL